MCLVLFSVISTLAFVISKKKKIKKIKFADKKRANVADDSIFFSSLDRKSASYGSSEQKRKIEKKRKEKIKVKKKTVMVREN